MAYLLLMAVSLQGYGTINGFVGDASNGEKLPFANVYLEDTDIGTATNDKGYYIIEHIPQGKYHIIFSYIGYKKIKQEIEIISDTLITLNVELHPALIKLKGAKVTAQRIRFEKEVGTSKIVFSQPEIRTIPKLFEADLIKVIQLMPGVTSMHNLSNKLYIRGGSPDENLVLLDGITIYNPSTHLFGLFSTFNPDIVSSVKLFSGGFPVKYGDRLSAVIDITTKEGNSKKITGKISTSLISSKVLIEGPIPHGSFLLNGRRTYFDLIAKAYSAMFKRDINFPYYFYDGVAKLNYNPSQKNRFTLSAMTGADILNFLIEEDSTVFGRINMNWGNRGISLKWRTLISPKLYGEVMGVISNFFTYFYFADVEKNNEISYPQGILDYTLKGTFNYLLSEKQTIDFGVNLKRLKFTESFSIKTADTTLTSGDSSDKIPYSFATYVQDKIKINPLFYIQPGARILYYNIGNRFKIEPRISLKYRIRNNTALNFSAGHYSQFLTTLNSQESYFSIFDIWHPIDKEEDIPGAYHIVGGIEQWIGEGEKFTVETYYKKYDNLLISSQIPGENSMSIGFLSESLLTGTGYSTGIDLYIKKTFSHFYGWMSYSLGFTKRQVNGISYFPRYDRRHTLNILLGSKIPEKVPIFGKISLNLHWYLGTGLPYADYLGRYEGYLYEFDSDSLSKSWNYVRGQRDAYRYPLSHRMDLHIERQIKWFRMNGNWYMDFINLYAHKDIVFYTWEYNDPKTGEPIDLPKKVGVSFLPYVIPSIGVNFRF